jgi:hypothetical protein
MSLVEWLLDDRSRKGKGFIGDHLDVAVRDVRPFHAVRQDLVERLHHDWSGLPRPVIAPQN